MTRSFRRDRARPSVADAGRPVGADVRHDLRDEPTPATCTAHSPQRRQLIAGALSATALAATGLPAPQASAQAAWPARPVRLVIAFPPGGATDVLGRAIGAKLAEQVGQAVVIENRPGAGGFIGMEAAAKGPADGHTVFLAAITNVAIAANLYPNPPHELARDFVPVALIANVPHILVVHPSVPARTVGEFAAWLKSNDGKVNYASQGNGTLSHLESELLRQRLGVTLTHVPYKGSSQALPDLIAGNTSMMFDSIPASMPHVKTGKLRALAVAASRRTPLAPELPTLSEAGIPGYGVDNWFGIWLPKGAPRELVERLDAELRKVLTQPELRERMQQQGVDLFHEPAERLATTYAGERERWGKVIRESGVTLQGA